MARQKTPVPNDTDLGEPIAYDPDFKGPLKNRSCTDILCLLLFLVFIACWIAIGIYAFKEGNINALILPKDSKGRICGIDNEVQDRPYLFFHDITKCITNLPFTSCSTPQVCVKQCPQETYINTNNNNVGTLDVEYCIDNSNSNTCPSWYLPSGALLKRCLYNVVDRKRLVQNKYVGDEVAVMKKKLNTVKYWLNMFVQNIITIFTQDDKVLQVGENIVADLTESWVKILIGILIASISCVIYIAMLRWLAAIMVWLSLIGVLIALGAAVVFTGYKYKDLRDLDDDEQKIWLAALILSSIVLAIVLIILIFLRKRIVLAIALIKEGSKAVSSVTSVLLFPIVPWILQIGVIAYAICAGLYLSTTGTAVYRVVLNQTECSALTNNAICNPDDFDNAACPSAQCKFVKMDNPSIYPLLQTLNVFGFFWLAFFASAFGEMVLASVFAQWYWTFNKRNLPFFAVTESILRVLRYHIGTLAFGSLIIAICRMIRVCLEYIDHKLKKYDNGFTKAILCCLKCFFWCLEKFLKFINKNAYIMCAIHGKNFCTSAKDAFLLLMRNIIRVFVLDKITDFLFFLSTLLVTLGVGAVAYVCFATDLTTIDNSTLNYGLTPVITIMIATFLICSVFFNVYSMAVDTLFLCFLEDCERNDGSPEKPYYMSRNLMKILGKKNKRA